MRNGSIVETCDLKVKKNANKERKNDKDILLNDKQSSKSSSTKETLKSLGPGLITGASDDAPFWHSNIFSRWSTVRLWNVMDGIISISYDDSHSGNVCKDRSCDR